MNRATVFATALAVVAAATPGYAAEGGSDAINKEMIEQLDAELDRSMKELKVPGEAEPYFIGFKLTEVEVNDVSASLGAALSRRERHFMNLDASVRVGDYSFDNSNFVIPRQEATDGLASIALPLEATPSIAKKAAWLATDAAFQEALAQYTAKKANLDRKATSGAKVDSYSKEPPLVKMDAIEVPPLDTVDDLETKAKQVSAVFRDHEAIRESHVAYTSFLERRWYFNTEGTRAHDIRRVAGVIIVATTRVDDGDDAGEILSLYTSHYGRSAADLPSVAALEKEANQLAKTLEQMRSAKVLGTYTGPILFEGAGAAAITRLTLAPQLSGTPIPDGSGNAGFLGGKLTARIGMRVVAPLLSVYDDPTTSKAGKHHLIGGFLFDDEGVKPRKVNIIENGKLSTLLMSRTPSDKLKRSNGHARRGGTGVFHGSTTNLFVKGKKGKSAKALRKALIKEAKDQGLDFGLVIKRIDDPIITASGEIVPRDLLLEAQSRGDLRLPPALLAYKVYPNGKQELVRGVQLENVDVKAWRDVIAVGKKTTVTSYLATNDEGAGLKIRGGGPGFVPSAGIESSVITPDLLFRELDVRRTPSSLVPAPAVKQP